MMRIKRREFLKAGAAASALASLYGCAGKESECGQ